MDNLYTRAQACLTADDPAAKVAMTRVLATDWEAGAVCCEGDAPAPLAEPGRPERPCLVAPRDLPRRRLSSARGRAALVHAIAHIELNAINLALDAVQRFSSMPREFHADWLSVAVDEARHFELLSQRLGALGYGYGDFPGHDGLWDSARRSAGDPLLRMALVPRVLEARGLDVTPGMIARLEVRGDRETVAVLELILAEEVRHVAIGSRWFRYLCEQRGLDPERCFAELVAEHFPRGLGGPFNLPARRAAGFSESELAALAGAAAGSQ